METVETHDITDASEEEINELLGYEPEEESGEDTVDYIRRKAEELKERGADFKAFESRHLEGRDWVGQDEYDAAMNIFGFEPEPLPSHLQGICDDTTTKGEAMSRRDQATLKGYENAFLNKSARMKNQPTP